MLKNLKEYLKFLFYTVDEQGNLRFDLIMVVAIILLIIIFMTVVWVLV